MAWERLRVFAAVAEHGSVTAAAASLYLTGPAVTQQLRKLEREAGTRLVEPDGRGIRLTAAGHLLAGSAQQLAAVAAQAERDLATVAGQMAGPLRIGAVASALRTLLPDALHALTLAHPRLVPIVRDGEVLDLLPALRARGLDAVLVESWAHRPTTIPAGIRVRPLLTEDVLLAVPADHRCADRPVVALAELTGEVWTSCAAGTEPFEGLAQALRAVGLEPDVRYRVADFTTQLRLVAAGLAVATVPRMTLDALPSGVVVRPCAPALRRSIGLAVRDGDGRPALRALFDALVG